MAEANMDEFLSPPTKPRISLLDRPSVTSSDFADVISRPSLVASIDSSLREMNGALDELTGKKDGGEDTGWRKSMMKQASKKLGGKQRWSDMEGIGEDQVYDYSERNDDEYYSSDDGGEFQSIRDLQKELDDAGSLYSEDEDDEKDLSVIGGDLEVVALESEAARDRVPPEIQVNSPIPKTSGQTSDDSEKENTENSQRKKEEHLSDQEYEIGMQQVKYRALQEKMAASQAESERMLLEHSQELEAEKEAKSMLELQFLKLQQDYDKLCKEKEELYKINKLQQQAILDLQSKKARKRWGLAAIGN